MSWKSHVMLPRTWLSVTATVRRLALRSAIFCCSLSCNAVTHDKRGDRSFDRSTYRPTWGTIDTPSSLRRDVRTKYLSSYWKHFYLWASWQCAHWNCLLIRHSEKWLISRYHTHARLTALCPGLRGWAGTRKVKPIWILLKRVAVASAGLYAPRSTGLQITTPAPNHSVFTGRMHFLPPNQQRQSTEGLLLNSLSLLT